MELKKLMELRNDKVTEMQALIAIAKTENRTVSEEETTKFDALDKEIKSIDATIKMEERARDLKLNVVADDKKAELKVEEVEERAFDEYLRDVITENRANNLEKSTNGAVVPKTIANRIIETVKDICTIYNRATKYTIKGELTFPVYDDKTTKVNCAYATEFVALTSSTGVFTSVSLTGFLAGALAKVSVSLVNNSEFNLVNYVVQKVAEAISEFLSKELLVGTTAKMTGAVSTTTIKTAASATAITSDELISLKMAVKKRFRKNSIWIMNNNTFEAIVKLKDGQGNYLVINDYTTGFEPRLLGNEVEIDDNMPDMAAGSKAILYGDFSGLVVKITEAINVQVLREKYADEHALGVIGWIEADSKVVEPQKIAVLTMKAA